MTDSEARAERRIEVGAVVLLALAALATAWASYQAARWRSEQAQAQARATAIRVESTRASDLANGQSEVDVATFIQWVDARARNEVALADFYESRFRDEFATAFEAWIATDPFETPDAPLTPFAMPDYQLAARDEAEQLEMEAEADAADAREDIQRADNYVLSVVLFAAALFFAGISTKLTMAQLRVVILGLGWLIYLGAVVWIVTFPVTVTV
jgi:hypothetical protein